MNCNPTITADEFKTIHNAVCDLDHLVHRLEEVLKPELYMSLVTARNNIRKGLEGAYKQDNDSFETKSNHFDDVKAQLGLDHSVWSIYEVDNLSDRHPYFGATKIVYKDHWGTKPVSCEVVGSTWAALYVAANACIRDSGDGHHTFIEQFKPSKEDAGVLILQTGS